jgi:hypothetical protein
VWAWRITSCCRIRSMPGEKPRRPNAFSRHDKGSIVGREFTAPSSETYAGLAI